MAETFTQRFQVRFDECAADGTARASTLLRYVIETAFGHSAAEGYPLSWYEGQGLFWLVRRARLDLATPVPYGQGVDVTTRVLGFRRIWARRQNDIRDAGGALRGEATMDWIFTDRAGMPARVLREMEDAFPGLTRTLDLVRLDLPDPPADAPTVGFRVPAHQVDPRGHLNSAAYLDLFEDALAEMGVDPQERPAGYELEYLRAVAPGENVGRALWSRGQGWAMVVTGAAGPVARARREPGRGSQSQ
ncbi:MAG TPA: acyl-ACP thioesterase domain-containing protein [bacterium]|jgi:acyl-ACP thioesterase|nr:acyl-ACP thioesterase domain-containing protein [bacterium]